MAGKNGIGQIGKMVKTPQEVAWEIVVEDVKKSLEQHRGVTDYLLVCGNRKGGNFAFIENGEATETMLAACMANEQARMLVFKALDIAMQ